MFYHLRKNLIILMTRPSSVANFFTLAYIFSFFWCEDGLKTIEKMFCLHLFSVFIVLFLKKKNLCRAMQFYRWKNAFLFVFWTKFSVTFLYIKNIWKHYVLKYVVLSVIMLPKMHFYLHLRRSISLQFYTLKIFVNVIG